MALRWFEAEYANLVAAVSQATSQGPAATGWRLADSMYSFFDMHEDWSEWQAINESALAATRRAGNRSAEAQTLANLGNLYRRHSRLDHAIARLQESLAIYRKLGDRQRLGATLANLGNAYRDQRRFDEAIAAFEESLTIRRELGDRHGETHTNSDVMLSVVC
jgi:tetratricopeptide (TPR) repeat protein